MNPLLIFAVSRNSDGVMQIDLWNRKINLTLNKTCINSHGNTIDRILLHNICDEYINLLIHKLCWLLQTTHFSGQLLCYDTTLFCAKKCNVDILKMTHVFSIMTSYEDLWPLPARIKQGTFAIVVIHSIDVRSERIVKYIICAFPQLVNAVIVWSWVLMHIIYHS